MAPTPRRPGVAGLAAGCSWGAQRPLLRRLPMVLDSGSRFLVAKADPAQVRIAPDPDAPAARELQPGEARLVVRQFELDARTLDAGGADRWSLFPGEDGAWGCAPVWGLASVDESRCPGLEVGTRVFGRMPMGTHLVVQPAHVSDEGFVDGAPHRSALPATWQWYARRPADAPTAPSRGAAAVEAAYRALLAGGTREGRTLAL